VKGLFPWIREVILGPKKPTCADSDCFSRPVPIDICGAGLCAYHHNMLCVWYEKTPRCAAARDGQAKVDLAFLGGKK